MRRGREQRRSEPKRKRAINHAQQVGQPEAAFRRLKTPPEEPGSTENTNYSAHYPEQSLVTSPAVCYQRVDVPQRGEPSGRVDGPACEILKLAHPVLHGATIGWVNNTFYPGTFHKIDKRQSETQPNTNTRKRDERVFDVIVSHFEDLFSSAYRNRGKFGQSRVDEVRRVPPANRLETCRD